MSPTKEILVHHLKCFSRRDLDGIMADYSSDAVLFTPEGLFKGPDEIRSLFLSAFAEFAKPGASIHIHQQMVEGNYAYILWTADTADNSYEAATDIFVIQNGKIIAQSFAAKATPKKTAISAEAPRTPQR